MTWKVHQCQQSCDRHIFQRQIHENSFDSCNLDCQKFTKCCHRGASCLEEQALLSVNTFLNSDTWQKQNSAFSLDNSHCLNSAGLHHLTPMWILMLWNVVSFSLGKEESHNINCKCFGKAATFLIRGHFTSATENQSIYACKECQEIHFTCHKW